MRPAIGAGFQEHGIHGRFRGDARGLRLQVLRATDLSAVAAYTGVVRHVLSLERSDRDAAARERPAQPGDHQRLSRVGGRTRYQDAARLTRIAAHRRSVRRVHMTTGACWNRSDYVWLARVVIQS